jgi:hypothetical protein
VGEKRNAYGISMGNAEGKRPVGRSRYRWEKNIKMKLRYYLTNVTGSPSYVQRVILKLIKNVVAHTHNASCVTQHEDTQHHEIHESVDGTTHRISESQNGSTAISTNNF